MHQPESPLDYTTAAIYTNDLLDAYMDFKNLWKKLHLSKYSVTAVRRLLNLVVTSQFEIGQATLSRSKFDQPDEVRLLTQNTSNNDLDDLARALEKAAVGTNADFQAQAKELQLTIKQKASHHHSDYTYAPTISGLMKARADCRAEMIKIVHEVRVLSCAKLR